MIIVDTDIPVDIARMAGEAVRCIEQIEVRSMPAISAVTHMEMIVGCGNKRELQTLDNFPSRFHIIPIDEDISNEAVSLLREYRLSHGLLIADAMIAATAIVYDTQFVSNIR